MGCVRRNLGRPRASGNCLGAALMLIAAAWGSSSDGDLRSCGGRRLHGSASDFKRPACGCCRPVLCVQHRVAAAAGSAGKVNLLLLSRRAEHVSSKRADESSDSHTGETDIRPPACQKFTLVVANPAPSSHKQLSDIALPASALQWTQRLWGTSPFMSKQCSQRNTPWWCRQT